MLNPTEVDLHGKVALVTGAGSGLGEATARTLAGAGARVAVVDLRQGEAKRVAQAINLEAGERSSRALALGVDVSNWGQVNRAVKSVESAWGRLDIVVNNAGIDYTLSVSELTADQFEKVIGVNLTGAFLTAKAAWPLMVRQEGGHVVNIGSMAGKRGWANASAYCASKWGLNGLTQVLVAEGRPHNIRATLIVPGGMRTHFFDRLDPPPDPRNLNDPYHVARAIAFVVSQPADSIIHELLVASINETSWP